MSAKEKVPCPICGEYFAKVAINSHANKCLNVQQSGDEENDNDTSCHDATSPPKKQTKLYDGSKCSSLSSTTDQVLQHKEPKNSKQTATTSFSPKLQKSSQNAFNTLMTRSSKSTKQSPKQLKAETTRIFSTSDTLTTKSHTNGTEICDLDDKILKQATVIPEQTLPNVTLSAKPNVPFHNHNTSVKGQKSKSHQPLAERMRPVRLEDYVGQEHVIGQGKMMRDLLMSHTVPSMIFWGPPGCGKTTLARIIAARCKETHDTRFVSLSATTAGVADVKEMVKVAKNELRMMKRKTILFVDEIHRFNKLQQDTFLPHIEDGTITLLGATTENPSFHVNNALLSRCKLVVLEKLTVSHIEKIITKALVQLDVIVAEKENLTNDIDEAYLMIDPMAVSFLARHCDGDARAALNTIQETTEARRAQMGVSVSRHVSKHITIEDIKDSLQRSHVQYDKTGEEHYNCASALQKSIRGSDDSAAIYWMTRMLEGGEDPMFIARRLVVCASEDIGLADDQALPLAVSCQQACHLIGKPECAINLAHCVTYLARAPKSNESFKALSRAWEAIRNHEGPLPGVPLHLRNAPTKLMKSIGYGKGYKYSHNYMDTSGKQEYLPHELKGVSFFKDQAAFD